MPAQYPADVYNRDDETLLKFLQGGGAGRGPEVDKAIQDLLKQRGASGFAKQAYDFDPQRQNTSSAVDPLRDPGAYASTGFNTSQATKIQSAQTNYFQDFLNSLSPEERSEIEGFGDLSEEDKKEIGYNYAAQQKLGIADSPFATYQKDRFGNYKIPTLDSLVSYDPNWGEYGGYTTKEDLGFSPTSVLYDRYKEWSKNNPVPEEETRTLRAIRKDPTLGGTAGYTPTGLYRISLDAEDLRKLAEYDAAEAARSKAFEDLYKTPLSQIKYKNFSEAPSLQAFRDQFSPLGIDIPLMSDGGYFVRRATEQDPEVQQFGIYNVGRQDYRQTRINEGTQKNIELLKQQEELGDVASILPPAMTQGDLYRAIQERGSSSPGTKEYGELRDLQKEWIQRQQKLKGAEAPQENQPVDVRVARAAEKSDVQRERLAQQSEFDISKEKQLASAKAADAYRRSAASEDPFRAAARVG